MKTKILYKLLLIVICSYSFAMTPEEKGLDIAKQTDTVNSGFRGESANMKMILINAHGDKVERKMTSKSKEIKDDGDKSVITFIWPADVKGTKMLTWTHKKEDDDQWLYLPALKRVKRISSRSKTGSFMGSEFSYEDLGSQEVEKYTYKYIKDATYNKKECWVSERYPKDKKSGYSKQLVWTQKDINNPVKIEYYDRKGELLKTATFKGYKKIKKWWRAKKIKMVNHQTQKRSTLIWKKRKIGLKFSNKEFHKNKLKR